LLAQFVGIPPERVPAETLQALLEEYASRDGTDYGERETPLETRVERLLGDLRSGRLRLLFDLDSEQWDLLPADEARHLLEADSDAARD
jgi:uncharacterized protein YheU (UPF0270 family)